MKHRMKNVWRTSGMSLILMAGLIASTMAIGATQRVRSVSYDKMAATNIEPKVTKVRLDPTRGWVNSGVFLKEGDLLNITADGLIDPGVRLSRGPDGQGRDLIKEMTHGCTYMELLGRIGDGNVFCIGASGTFEVIEGGNLSFHVNEIDTLRYDDQGHFNIQVRVVTPSASSVALTAVLDLVPINLSNDEARVLSLALRGHLARTNKYALVDPNQVSKAIRKMRINPAETASPQTAAKIGNTLGASKVVIGQVGRIGASYTVTLQMVDVPTGKVDNTVVEVFQCSRESLPAKLAVVAKKL